MTLAAIAEADLTPEQNPTNDERGSTKNRTVRNQRRQPVTQRPRRAIVKKIALKSEVVNGYLFRGSDRLEGVVGRIASLMQLTAKEPKIRERLTLWLDGELEEAKRKATLISDMRAAEHEGLDDVMSDIRIDVPEQYQVEFRITHPIFWRIIDLIQLIDDEAAEMETLWQLGVLPEERHEAMQGLAANAIKRLVGRLHHVATRSSGRKGGVFSEGEFEEIMSTITKVTQQEAEAEIAEEQAEEAKSADDAEENKE